MNCQGRRQSCTRKKKKRPHLGRQTVALAAADVLLPVREVFHDVDADALSEAGGADGGGAAAGAEAVDHGADDGGDAGAVDGEVCAVGGAGAADLGDDVRVGAEHGVGGAEAAGEVEAGGLQVDGDDDGGAAEAGGGHDGGHADGADAEDGDRRALAHVERVEHGAGARLHAAAERRVQGEVGGGRHRHGAGAVDERVPGEGRLAEEAAEDAGGRLARPARQQHRGGPVRPRAAKVAVVEAVAVGRVARRAGGAGLAVREGQQHLVARPDVRDGRADLEDDAGACRLFSSTRPHAHHSLLTRLEKTLVGLARVRSVGRGSL